MAADYEVNASDLARLATALTAWETNINMGDSDQLALDIAGHNDLIRALLTHFCNCKLTIVRDE